jgi:hypothetical protein
VFTVDKSYGRRLMCIQLDLQYGDVGFQHILKIESGKFPVM